MSETVCEPDHYDEKVEKCFSHLDTNDPYYSEKISAEKLFTLLEKGKIGLMKEEIDKLKQLADIDENGMLNYREFTKKFLKENDNI
jgi:Ca2+-binding EF-hand superfamily protein